MSATRSGLGRLGIEDSLLATGQQLCVITKGGLFGDATHTADKNSGKVIRPGIRFYNVHVIVKNVVSAAMFAVTLFKSSPDRATTHAVFFKGAVHNK